MSFVFNPFTATFDNVIGIGSKLSGSTASEILYTNAANVLAQSSGLMYFDTLPGNAIEYALSISSSLARSGIDVGNDTRLSSQSLTVNDDISFGNDGTVAYTVDYKQCFLSGSITQAGAIGLVTYTAQSNLLFSVAALEVTGDADMNVQFYGLNNAVNINSLSIPNAGDAPTIYIYGSYNVASAQVSKDAAATPYLVYTGTYSKALRGGGTTPDVCTGGEFIASQGTLNYGIKVNGTTAGVYSTGHVIPSVNNTYDSGTSALRFRKVWAVAGDYSGTLTTGAGRVLFRRAISDAAATVAATDEIIAYTSLTAARTATLPNATGNSGQTFTIKDESGSCAAFNITIATSGGNIDGAATFVMKTAYQSVTVYSNGTNYFII